MVRLVVRTAALPKHIFIQHTVNTSNHATFGDVATSSVAADSVLYICTDRLLIISLFGGSAVPTAVYL